MAELCEALFQVMSRTPGFNYCYFLYMFTYNKKLLTLLTYVYETEKLSSMKLTLSFMKIQ